MYRFYYVYILRLSNGDYYVGRSDDLRRRVDEHKSGKVEATRDFLPCSLVTYIAFSDKHKACVFETYLKSGSGFAFRNRHLV